MQHVRVAIFATSILLAGQLKGQQEQPTVKAVPRLLRVNNTFHPVFGPASPVESVTMSIYSEEHAEVPLWSETQNVNVDPEGHYSVLIGSTRAEGIPADLFGTGEARWLGVRFNRIGEVEQPRTLTVSVPYALKAADTEMLGGRPASAYMLAPASGPAATEVAAAPASGSSRGQDPAAEPKGVQPRANSGQTNCIGLFTDQTDLGCSAMWQSAGNVGLGTTTPVYPLDLSGKGITVLRLNGTSGNPSSNNTQLRFAGGKSGELWAIGTDIATNNGSRDFTFWALGGVGPMMTLQNATGNVGIGTSSPGATLDLSRTANDSGVILGLGNGGAPYWQFSRNAATGALSIQGTQTGYNNLLLNPSAGNVGIGTTTPAYKLDVAGTVHSMSGGFVFPDGSVQSSAATPGGGGSSQWTSNGTGILYNGGNVGIGTSNPASRLDVGGDINLSGMLRVQGSSALLVGLTNGVTAAGFGALSVNASGTNNTATGHNALALNTTGSQNTAGGGYALSANTSGSHNTAHGYNALESNITGSYNTATGYSALAYNAGAYYNTATGAYSLFSNSSGQDNTASGYYAMYTNTIGGQNTADGYYALYSNSAGFNNTAIGFNALYSTTGNNNIAVGYQAGYVVSGGSYNIHVGSQGSSTDNATIRIGTPGTQTAFFAAGIRGVTTGMSDAISVYIDSNGQLGTVSSSRRFKEDIHDMGDASLGLMRLRPVTFRYKKPFADGLKPLQYGLIAEEVAEVYPDLVARSADGQIETVKYQELDSMLINEVQRLQADIGKLQEQLEDQRHQNQLLEVRLSRIEAELAANMRRRSSDSESRQPE
jgi:hypothetical protein